LRFGASAFFISVSAFSLCYLCDLCGKGPRRASRGKGLIPKSKM
jgi:hypothetical protein